MRRRKIHTPNISSYNIFPEMDQIQEKKTTKSTIRNMSKNYSFIPSLSHLQKPYDNHYETQVWSRQTLNEYALWAIFWSFSLLFDHRAAWLSLKYRADSTFKSRMCRGILRDVIYQTRATVFYRDIQTPRRELKIRRAAEYFWRNSRCLDIRWNIVSSVWYIFSIETKTKE